MASVDRIQGLSGQQAIKTPCRLATTAAITLSGEQTIDGVAAVEGDRVLVKDQADTTANGVYDVSTGSWTRSLDFDGANDIADGTMVLVGSGSTNADLVFKLNATEPITIGTTALTFTVATTFTDISAFGATLLDDVNAAAARATLGAVGLTGNETVAGNKTLSGDTVHTGKVTMTSKSIVEAEGAAVASAASCNIWAGDGNTVHITGTTQIDDFATAPQAGAWMRVIFDDALILNQSANLNLNGGGADITTAAGDMAFVYADTTTQMDVFVVRKSGREVAPPTPVISVSYDSGDQTISSGGGLSLTHSLGAKPKAVQFYAKCLTGEHDYSTGDEIQLGGPGVVFVGAGSSSCGGFVSIADATTITVRFGNGAANPIIVLHKTSGALSSLTNANWAFIVRAYA